jgi:DNA polymerase-3 subunit beta
MSDLELSIDSKSLKAVLARAAGAAQAKSTLPSLAMCHLDARDGRLTATTTDLVVSERSSAEAAVKTAGSICVDARKLTDTVKLLPPGDVKLRVQGNALELRVGKSKHRFGTTPGDEFPAVPASDAGEHVATIASDELLRVIAQGGYAMSSDSTRPHLCGVMLELADDRVTAISTDGHRLAIASGPAKHSAAQKLLVPAKGVAELKKLCAGAEQVEFRTHGARMLLLSAGETTVSCMLGDEQFPPWQKVVPKSHEHRVTVARELLIDALRRAQVVSSASIGGGVRLVFGDGDLSIYAEDAVSGGDAHEAVECDASFALTIGLASGYFLQALSALTTEEVVLELSGALDPVVVKGLGDEQAFGVCMPQRI